MIAIPGINTPAREVGRLAWLAGAVWTVLIILSLAIGLHEQRKSVLKQAEEEARATVDMDLSFRNWIIRSGGLYIIPSGKTPGDIFLHTRNKNIKTAAWGGALPCKPCLRHEAAFRSPGRPGAAVLAPCLKQARRSVQRSG